MQYELKRNLERNCIGWRFALKKYRLYGLCVESQWPLPCPIEGLSEPSELKLYEGSSALFAAVAKEAEQRFSTTQWVRHAKLPDGADYVQWPELFEFVITADGRRITARFFSDSSLNAFQTYLLGQVISYALLKQGIESLHATVVVLDGEAVAFLGNSGYGKSSLGAAFIQAGASLLTDDLLVARGDGKGWIAYPGPARIKLFPEAAQLFLGKEVAGVAMNPFTSKLVIPLSPTQAMQVAAPLKAVYVLRPPATRAKREKVTIRRRSQRQACLDVIAGTFNSVVRGADRLTQLFDLGVRLASTIPIKSLSYPQRLPYLPEVVEAVRADLKRTGR